MKSLLRLLVLTAVLLIDQTLKNAVVSGRLRFESVLLTIAPHLNRGLIGGSFSGLHPWIIRIFFSSLFGFLVLFTALILHFMKHKNVPRLKWGMILYAAGILGNVWDRATMGRIVDFIILNIPFFRNYAFNFSDLVLGTGLVFMVVSLFRDYEKIWHENNLRKNVLIEKNFQLGLSGLLVLVGAINFIIAGLYSFTFLRVYLSPLGDMDTLNSPSPEAVIHDYLIGLAVLQAAFLLITFLAGIVFTHRIVGPIVAFQRFIDRLLRGELTERDAHFRLRRTDSFKSLETTAKKLKEKFQA